MSNHAETVGGGIFAHTNSSICFYASSDFRANTANYGGGVVIASGYLAFSEPVNLEMNLAIEGRGGGIAADHSSVQFNASVDFKANLAWRGGGMALLSSELVCSGPALFDSNRARTFGGGIAGFRSSLVFCGNTTLTANSAGVGGGGMSIKSCSLSFIRPVEFKSNRVRSVGGGILAFTDSSVFFYASTTFATNTALRFGAGMAITSSELFCNGPVEFESNLAGQGGGLFADFNSSVWFYARASFTGNTAKLGGGMRIFDANLTCDGSILFDGNSAEHVGGGFLVGSDTQSIMHGGNTASVLHPILANFEPYNNGNSARTYQIFKHSVVIVNNKAQLGGGIISFQGYVLFLGNVTFCNNSAMLLNDSFGLGGGLFAYLSILGFLMYSNFTGNTALDGGGIYGSKTTLVINGSFSTVNNTAVADGGGFYFASGSECWIADGASLQLSHNHAGQNGGAVYVKDDPFFYCIKLARYSRKYQVNCFLQPTRWPTTATIQIVANSAGEAGSQWYGGLLDECKPRGWKESNFNGKANTELSKWIFQYSTPKAAGNSSFVSSDPIRVCLCVSSTPHCNLTESQHGSIFPGSTLRVSVVATGQRNGTVPAVITARFAHAGITMESHQGVQLVHKTCTSLTYRISLKKESDTSKRYTMTLRTESPCRSYGIPLLVTVHVLPCPSGFELSQTPYTSCICSMRVQQYTNTCDIDTQTILRHGQYWMGWDTSSSGAILHPHCPFDYCRSGNTSFPMNDSDKQCQHNRAGVLCGGCEHGYGLGFGSSRCLQCSTNSYLSLLLAFTLSGIILVTFLLTCKLTVAVGTINGLIFYANIVAANLALYFPKHNSEGAILRVFIAWINLDLGIETCFYRGMDMYTRTWLQFVFPLYIWTLVGMVIVLSHYFSWATKLFGSNPIAVLDTLFLLSYTKILRTIITAMSFTYLDYPDNPSVPVWLYDGNVRYLEGKHIALFIAALLALLLLFLPYTLVVFCGQWIEARSQQKLFRWISDYRVKAFLDAYHGPLKTNHRYWAGLLLVSRAFLLLVFAFNAFSDPSINLLATITCVIGLLTLLLFTGTIYNQYYLHILEISFIVNTLVLAACTGTLALTEGKQLALTYTSVSIAFATFIGILVYHTFTQVKDSRIWKDIIRPRLQRGQQSQALVELDEAEGNLIVTHQAVPTRTFIELRELLLED